MVIRATLTAGLLAAATAALPAFAQTNTTYTVREAVPAQTQAIIANSPEDLALQEEIRKIRAYNAHVDSLVGISGTISEGSATTYSEPYYSSSTASTYSGAKIELFEPAPTTTYTAPTTTYSSTVIAPSTTIIERQPVSGASSIYRVVEGDTLYNISKRNCLSVEDIQNQNNLSSSNIGLGQVLTIPASQCGMTTSVSTATAGYTRVVQPITTTYTSSNSYAVLPKDSLYSIGRRYCLSANEIASANGISTSSIIKPGQILQLPAGACTK